MKRLLKKGLSLLLAVLMVVSMLPTSAWAVTFADGEDSGREETPILDEGGDISSGAHVSGGTGTVRDRYDNPLAGEEEEESEETENPNPQESDVPADLNFYIEESDIEVVTDPTTGAWTVRATASNMDSDTNGGQWMVALIPDYVQGATGQTPTELWTPGSDGKRPIADDQVNTAANFTTNLARRTGQTAYDGSNLGTYVAVSNTVGFSSVGHVFTFQSGSTAGANRLPTPEELRTRLSLADGEQVYLRAFIYFQGTQTGYAKAQSVRVPYGTTENPAGVPSTTYLLNKSTGKVTYVSGTIGTKTWTNPNVTDKVDSNTSWAGTTLTVPIYNDTENVIGVDVDAAKLGMTAPANVSFVQIGNKNSGSIDIDAKAGTPGYRPAQITIPPSVNSGTVVVPVYPYAWIDEEGTIDTTDPLPQATVTVIVMSNDVNADPITFDIDFGDTTPKDRETVNIFSLNGDAITYLYVAGDPADFDTSVAIADDTWGIEVDRSQNGIYTYGDETDSTDNELIFGSWDGDADYGWPASTGSVGIKLTPPSDVFTITDSPYATTVTLGGVWGCFGDFDDATFGSVGGDPESGSGEVIIPVIINVHGGTAVFKDGDTVVDTIKGAPDKQVAPENTEGGVSCPAGSWTKNPDGSGTPLTAAQIKLGPRDGSVTYYKVKEVAKTTVVFDPKDGSATTSRTGNPGGDATPPTGYTVDTTVATISGKKYRFKGWSTTSVAPGSTAATTTSFKFPATGTQNYYGVWAEVFSVTYANAAATYPQIGTASLPKDTTAYEAGQSVTVKTVSGLNVNDTRAASDGKVYKFLGWSGVGSSKLYSGTFSMPAADTTLTAAWEEVTYTVKFEPDVGTKDITVSGAHADATNQSVGAAVTLPTISDSKGHYQFDGWAKTSGGTALSGTTYTVAVADDGDKDLVITLYAIWSEIKYGVEYADSATATDPKFGAAGTTLASTNLPATVQYMKDASVTVAAGPTGEHTNASGLYYTFNEWTTSDATVGADGKFTMPGNKVTLTASWTAVMLDVEYDLNGGTENSAKPTTGATKSVQKGDTYTINAGDPTMDGYTFKGWTATGGGSATGLKEGGTVAGVSAKLTLTAVWEAKKNTVNFLYNFASAPSSGVFNSQNIATDASPTDPGTPTREGYTFEGWYKEPACTNKVADVTGEVIKGDTNYYAKWTINSHNVIYASTFGTVASTHTSIATNYGATVTVAAETAALANIAPAAGSASQNWDTTTKILTVTAANGTVSKKQFQGWSPSDGGAASGTFTMPDKDVTLTARWKDVYTVTYAVPSSTTPGTITSKSVDVVSGDAHQVVGTGGNAPAPTTNTGYTFVGWDTTDSSLAGTADYTAGGTEAITSVTSNVTLYPVWKVNQHTLKYDMQGHGTSQKPADSTQNFGATVNLSTTPAVDYTSTESGVHWVFKGWMNAVGDTTYITSVTMPDADKTVYAKWENDTHSVTYNGNNGTLVSGDHDATTGITCNDPYTISTTEPTRTGYTFTGWNTVQGGTGTAYAKGATIDHVTSNMTLYAQWKINEYTVTFHKGSHGGSDVPAAKKGNYNTTVNLTETMATSTESNVHWTFQGWSTTQDDTSTKVTSFPNISADHDVYALWEQDTHSLTYNANAGTATVTNMPTNVTGVTCGTSQAVDVTTVPVWNAAHRFLGWDTNSGATTPTYPKGTAANITLTSNVTLYAIWESVVTVTWDENGGTWADTTTNMDANGHKTQTDTSGSAMTTYTGGTDVTRAGHRFKDWTNTVPSPAVMPNADTTYTARWDRLYNVLFDVNAPSGATDITVNPASVTKVEDKIVGETATLTALSDTQGNYVFKGWALASNATTATYTPTGTYTVVASHASGTDGDNAKITLYGVWVKKVKVEFQANGGTFATGATTTFYQEPGTTYTAPANPTRAGYDFASWSASTTGTTVGTIPTADTVYTAQWTPKKYDYIFDANNGSWPGSVTTQKRNQEVDTVVAEWGTGTGEADPTRTGYTFKGWGPDATSTVADLITFDNNGPKMPVDGTTVYAVWTPNEYTVTYNVGKNTSGQIKSGEDSQTVTYDDGTSVVKVGDLTNAATIVEAQTGKNLTGWTFVEWNDKADGSGNTWAAGADLDGITADMTLYAQWTVAVTFKPSEPEGTVSGDIDKTAPAGGVVTGFPNDPSATTNYTFKEWNTKADGTGDKVTATTTFDEPTTVYGQWTANQYTVHFVDNDTSDTNNPNDVTNDYGFKFNLPNPTGTKTGYTFAGWYAEAALTNKKGDAGAEYTITIKPETTLYGKWDPVDVTIHYESDVGTAPTPDDTKKYDATDYTAKVNSTITGGTWGTTGDGKPMLTVGGNRYRFNGWDILKADGSVLKQVASGGAINPVNTANGVIHTPASGDTPESYKLTLKANWTQLFSVTYEPGGHGVKGTQPVGQQNQPAGAFIAADPMSVINAATGDTWANRRYDDATTGEHWFFTGWQVGATSTIIADGDPVTTTNSDLVLTAQWEKRIQVTLGAPQGTGLVTTGTTNVNYVTAELNNGGKNSGTNNNTAWVPVTAGTDPTVGVEKLTLYGPGSGNYLFNNWTVDPADKGSFATTGGTAIDDTLTPTGDVTIISHWLLKPGLVANHDHYHLNYKTGETIIAPDTWGGTANALPKYTWTANDATMGTIVLTDASGATVATLIDGNQVDIDSTTTSGVSVITFERSFLLSLAKGTYKLTVNATTGTTSTPTEADLIIDVTPRKLLQLDIGVKPDTAANYETGVAATPVANRAKSASVTVAARNEVKYLDHRDTRITPSNLLTYEWYYGPTQPTQTNLSASANALTRNDIVLPSDAQKIKDNDTSGVVAVDNVNYKGQYIYAVAVATGTGTGAVITNSIPVDYDAAIAVDKDGSAIAAGEGNGYRVFLVPDGATTSVDASGNLTGTGVVGTTNDNTDNLYHTGPSALTGGVKYNVYVNKVEGDFTYYEDTKIDVTTQVSAATAEQTINFYSVNEANAQPNHAEDNSATPQKVGEKFGDGASEVPGTQFFANGVTAAVPNGNGVLKGSDITAKTANKTWTQDYHVDWNHGTGANKPTLTFDETNKQTKDEACDNGYTKVTSIGAKTWIGAQLHQNVYTIVGDIKGSGGKVDKATLTYVNTTNGKTYTFTGTTNGTKGDLVTFTVPKSSVAAGAITGDYLLTATGATTPQRTTIRGYSVPSKDDPDQVAPMTIQPVTATGNDKFTIFIDASTWQLKLMDDRKADALEANPANTTVNVTRSHTSEVTATTGTRLTGHYDTTWTKTFANYKSGTDQLTYTVTVSNPGNTDLTVGLVVKKTVGGTTTTILDSTTATVPTADSANNVAFGGLVKTFNLAAKTGTTEASRTFTVTIPEDLDNNDGVTYSFEFASVDQNTPTILGPILTYNLTLTVDPIPVKTVSIKANSDGTFSRDTLTFDATSAPLDTGTAPTLTTANDLTYQWYVGAKPTVSGSTVTGTVATGTGNNTATYTPAASDGGKALWLVVTGKNNASQYAISESLNAPFKAAVTILENTDPTTDYNSYKVYLVPNTQTTQPADWTAAGIVEATHKSGDADGVFTTDTVLVAGTTYNVWTNVVKGTTNAVYKNSGALSAISTTAPYAATKTVTYYSVTVNETTYDNQYTGLKGTDFFDDDNDPTTATTAQTGDTGITATTKAGATNVANGGWVIAGTEVDFDHAAWSKDYTLAWTNAAKQGTDAAGGGSAAKATVNANLTVSAELTLKLYPVTGYVIGKGDLQYITMEAGDNTFTTKTNAPGTDAIVAVTSGSQDKISATPAGKMVPFSVPKGTYTVEAVVVDGTTRSGYKVVHNTDPLVNTDTITKGVPAAEGFDVILTSTGIGLAVEDDDSGAGVTPHSASTIWQSGDPKSASTKHTETLEYGYTSDKDIVLTLSNNSSEETPGVKQTVYNIRGVGANTSTGDSKVTWTSTDLSKDGTTTTIPTLDSTTEPKVTLNIPTGLAAGTYTYTATFTFANSSNTDIGTLVYTLEIVVNPAEFDTVSMKYDGGSAALAANTVLEAGKALALNTATTKVNDVYGSLTGGTDYHYAWYASTDNSIVKADLDWDDTAGTVSVTGKTATAIGTADADLAAATIAANQGKYIYLVIYATANNGKVIEAAISDPVRAGFEGVVQIKENGTLQTSEPKTGGNAKYTVTIHNGGTTHATKWSDAAKGYVAWDTANDKAIHLDPSKTYTVKVSAYEGDTTTVDLTGQTISGGTLGTSNIATAEYFTVTAVATTAEHYVAAVGESFGTMPKPGLSVGGVDVDTKTVLKGQDVDAKFAETATGSGVAWTQDYTLTWQDKQDNAADGTSLDNTALTDTSASAVTGQTWSGISAKTYIGGKLVQKTYEITGTIVGTGSVASVVMTDGNSNANTTVPGGTINKDNEIENTNNNTTTGDQGDTITLVVVKGTYGLQANAATGTTVRGINWASGGFEPGASVSGKDVPTGTSFVVYLDAASAILQVRDTHTTPTAHTATSNAATDASNFKHADHAHTVFFSAMTADETQTVELENQGNTELTLDTPTLWKVNDGKTLADVKWDDWANANPVTAVGTNGAYSLTDVIAITNNLTDANKTLGAATAAADGTLGSFKSVTAGTVTVSQNVDVADSGIYIIRYTTGNNGPVVYYVLTLTVKPLPITGVSTDALTEAPGVGDKVQIENYAGSAAGFDKVMVDPGTGTAVAANSVATPALVDGTDVKYQWVRTATQMIAADVAGKLSVAADGTMTAGTGVTMLSGSGADSKQYTVRSADLDSYLYLVAYAPGAGLNASKLAVSGAVKTKESVQIQVTLNGLVQNTANKADPNYTIMLLPNGADAAVESNYIGTTWNPNAVAGNNDTKFYTAAIDTTKTYRIYAQTYQGGTTLVDTGLLGNGAATPKKAVVPYFTVNFTENLAVINGGIDGFKSYLPGGAATTNNAIQKALSVAVSDDKKGTAGGTSYTNTLANSGTPVLSGMNVKVTVDATKQNNTTTTGVKRSWSEAEVKPLHTMTTLGWGKDSDTATSGSKIRYEDSISSGNIEVDGSKTFNASLAPETFTVKFTVKDITSPTDTNTNITAATLSRDPAKEPGATGFAPITGTIADTSSDSKTGNTGDVVTFTGVPAGELVIAADQNLATKTQVVGYTWNDAGATPSAGNIVVVTTDTDKNEDTTGNTIQIQRATNLVQWMDNFNTVDASLLDHFVNSLGFQRVDQAGLTTDRSLPEGYDATTNAPLTYTARVKNVGTTDLEGFRITPNEVSGVNLEFDLSAAKVYAADGTEKTGAGSVTSTSGIQLKQGEYVEFPVKIVEGKKAQATLYDTAAFTASCANAEGLPANSSTYKPAYQVKAVVEAEDVTGAIFYGDDDFDGTAPAVAAQNGFDGQNFAYDILTEDELTAYLDGAARPDNVYTQDGYNDGGTVVKTVPSWLKLAQATGAFSVDATDANVGKGVHVQKTDDGTGNLTDKTDELKVFVKITSTDNLRLKVIVPVTIDVKTSKLQIITANTSDPAQKTLDGAAYRALYNTAATDPTYPGQGEDIAHGAKVLLEYFNYNQVENTNNTADVVDTNTAPNAHPAYAAGADRWDTSAGATNDHYGEVTKGTWSVAPASFDGTGDNAYAPGGTVTNEHDYVFTYTYTGTGDVDKYDYEGANITLTIPALVPPNFRVTYQNADATKPQVTVPVDGNSPYEPASTVTVLGVTGLAVGNERAAADGKVYKFLGWDKSGDTTNKYYSAGTGMTTSFTITADTTFTTTWEEVKYTVKYSGNGVTMTNAASFTDETNLSVGDQTTKASGTPTAANKLFLKWNTKADGTGKTVNKGDEYTVAAADATNHVITLYAQWQNLYTVTYAPGGTGVTSMPDPATVTNILSGTSHTISSTEPSRTGYTFTGWKSNVTGDTSNYKKDGAGNKTAITVNSNITLTAQWLRDKSTIVYDWNYEGSTDVSHTGNTGDRDTAVPNTAPAHTGWTWDGKWYVEDTCATEQTTFNFPATKGATVTYYAKWTRDTSKIAFALDGGTLAGYPQTYEGNTSEALAAANFPAAAPTKAGYTFTGWRGDDGKTYTASALPNFPATKDALLTITAQWTRDQSTVTFKLDGGSIDDETDDIVRRGNTGERMIATQFPVPNPVRRGYAFTGWLGEDGKTYDINDRPSYPADNGGNLNVTAQWRALVQGLKFSDERSNDAAVNDAQGKITLVDPDAVLTAPDLQKAFPPAGKVERTGEYIVYLDTEPRYTVALHSVGDPVYNMSVTATDARGVKYSELPVNVTSFSSADDVKVITLDLEALSGKLWAGEHHILLTATGNTEADGTGETVTATYELTFVIQKKPIPGANVIPDPNDPTNPGKTKVTDPDGEDLRKPDPKGNTPVDPPVITKTPTDPKPGETYEIKTTLEPDPNYIFEPESDPTDPEKKPNYTGDGKGDKDWPEGDPDLNVTVKPEDPGADVTYIVTVREPLVTIGAHLVTASDDATVTSAFSALIGKELRAYRAQSDDTEKYPRTGTTYGTDWWWSMGDAPGTVLNIQPGTDANGKEVAAPKFENNKTYVLTVKVDPDEVNYRFVDFQSMSATFDKDNASLKRDLTRQINEGTLKAATEGFTILVEENGNYYLRTYYRNNRSTGGGGGGGGGSVTCPLQVSYLLGLYGTTKDPVMEMVSGSKVSQVPNVSAITGYKFLGWSLAGPIGDADKDAKRTLVDPKTVTIESDTTFYAVYQPLYTHGRPFHEHYVIGYPNGNFGPSDNINRASVATIIARAVLPNFVEGADYGNPGNYSDVSGHWANSAIAYCTRYGVFKGYEDGTFRPDQPISRQELVLTLARLSGMQEGTAPFSDLSEAGDWAKGGIYTAYVKGWVNGYTDGTFRPTNPIARDETVKIFNAYLYRGVNAEGLSGLSEYVHSGVASNNTENGTTEYMTWPDVTKDQWAYYEIIEAANDHEYEPDETTKAGYTVPETWTKCWIDEKWRYNDDPNDGGPNSVATAAVALLRKYGVIA